MIVLNNCLCGQAPRVDYDDSLNMTIFCCKYIITGHINSSESLFEDWNNLMVQKQAEKEKIEEQRFHPSKSINQSVVIPVNEIHPSMKAKQWTRRFGKRK